MLKLFQRRSLQPSSVPIVDMPIPAEALAELREDDQYIVSYPRSGNRWLRVMLHHLLLLSRPGLHDAAQARALLPDLHQYRSSHLDLRRDKASSRFPKSHNLRALLGRRMIYLFRQPADTLVSQYHFVRARMAANGRPSLDEFCLAMLPEWIRHVDLALREHTRTPSDICFLSYESMHAQPREALEAATSFLGLPVTSEMIAQTIETKVFARDQARVFAQPTDLPRPVLRMGRVGASVEELHPETLARIAAATGEIYALACAASPLRCQ